MICAERHICSGDVEAKNPLKPNAVLRIDIIVIPGANQVCLAEVHRKVSLGTNCMPLGQEASELCIETIETLPSRQSRFTKKAGSEKDSVNVLQNTEITKIGFTSDGKLCNAEMCSQNVPLLADSSAGYHQESAPAETTLTKKAKESCSKMFKDANTQLTNLWMAGHLHNGRFEVAASILPA